MSSGRKKRIMIACVTFETAKVSEPIDYYEINKAHIIHYAKDPSDKDNVYASFYNRVVELIDEISPKIEIVEHNEKVYKFSDMLRTVLEIIQEEKDADPDCDIYVNISSGSPEYAAASAIASMMMPGTIPFSVNSEEYTVSGEKIRDVYFIDGKPVGLTKKAKEPYILPCYDIEKPEEHLVRGLRVMHERIEQRLPVTSGPMIADLKAKEIWYRDIVDNPENKANKRQTEAVYYQRDFIGKWVKYGWIEKDELRGKYNLTDKGRSIVNTFYTKP